MHFELLIPILAILIGGLVVLLPIAGLTARFALKPVVEAWTQLRASHGEGQGQLFSVMEQRLALMEQQLHGMESSLRRLEEVADFSRQLAAPRPRSHEGVEARTPRVPAYEAER